MNSRNLKDKLNTKIRTNGRFYKLLALFIAIDLAFVGVFAFFVISWKDITVTVNGKSAKVKTSEKTVEDLLKSWGVKLEENDEISTKLSSKLEEGMELEIKEFEVKEITVEEETDYSTEEYYSTDYLEGESSVTTEGKKGKDSVTYKVFYLGGEETGRKEVARETVEEPTTEKVAVGTAVAYNGVKYSKKLTVVSTGYTHTGHKTATGTSPKRGTMAVDRSVIAMGSYGYVPGYGTVHAEDTGGAVKGNRIDLFFETKSQALKWGRRTVTIYIK